MKLQLKYLLGQSLVEIVLIIGLAAIILPALLVGLIASTGGKAQSGQRAQAVALLKETEEAVRSVREKGWSGFATAGTYHPSITSDSWTLVSGPETLPSGFTRSLAISDVYRDTNGVIIASSGGKLDPSSKKVDITISWGVPYLSSVNSTMYVTNFLENNANIKTTQPQFDTGIKQNVQTLNGSGGEVVLGFNKAKWCSPEFSSSAIDLPDGPPVAVAARANASTSTPNDAFVATSPTATASVKMAYVKVTANSDPPVSTLHGMFTLDAGQYSNPSYVPSGIGIDNNFKTNDVAYYTSSGGKLYALVATDMPSREVIAILMDDADLQDPTNKIYKYKTFFNTRRYQGNTQSTPNQDQAPFGYGAVSVAVLGNRGYTISGGYLYVFDLSNIDSKTTNNGFDMVGCRIQVDGYDCSPGTGVDRKYSSGQTGTSWGDTTTPAHNDCSDGGNIELYADNDIFPIQVGSNTYVYVAVGAGTNPEFEIANVTSVPTGSSSPSISSNSCGRISGGNSGWRMIDSLDFNTGSGTEEAANSVFAKSDGTRAYVSSNGGIFGGGGSNPNSWQFYVIDTSTKNNIRFLSGTSSATSGYYYGTDPNDDLFPRRSLTVLNGQRAILVGKDGFLANAKNPKDYQVLNIETEATPAYCGGLDFDAGFNDLTSVSEADGDNFVYMVANTQEKQLKIIQGGPDAIYVESGVYTPAVYDFGSSVVLNRITMTVGLPSGASVSSQVAGADPVAGSCSGVTFNYVGPDGTSGSFFPATGGPIPLDDDGAGYENPARCFSYKIYLSTTDYNQTPTVYDVTVNYSTP